MRQFILLLYQLFESFVSRTAESDASSLTEDVLSWVHEKCCLACLRPRKPILSIVFC